MTDLQAIKLNKDTRLRSFDIENMYTNIPNTGIINIINNIFQNNHGIETNIQKEVTPTYSVVLSPLANYTD
jgi:hypothetical protein